MCLCILYCAMFFTGRQGVSHDSLQHSQCTVCLCLHCEILQWRPPRPCPGCHPGDDAQYTHYIALSLSQLHTPATFTSLLQTVLDISSCLAENASYSMAGEALTHAVTTVQQVQYPPSPLCSILHPLLRLVFCFVVSELFT